MIGEPPLLTVRRTFPRPAATAVESLCNTPTVHLVDSMDGRGALDYRIKPIDKECCEFVGVALTCQAGPADNLAVLAASGIAQPGDVIIAATDGFVGTALVGDLILGMISNCGVVAFVTDGLIRDMAGILEVGVPTFCVGVTPNSCHRSGPGTIGLPITLGGVTINPGDIVIGDCDGVVIVPQDKLSQVTHKLQDVRTAEKERTAAVRDGLEIPDFIRELLSSDRVQNI